MATTIATKADLQLLEQKFSARLDASVAELRQEITFVRKDLEILSTAMTVRLGSMLIVGLRLLFAALKMG